MNVWEWVAVFVVTFLSGAAFGAYVVASWATGDGR